MAFAACAETSNLPVWLSSLMALLPSSTLEAAAGGNAAIAKERSSRDEDDAVLAGMALQGDSKAFERLIRRHYDLIHRVAWRQSGSQADAEDIAQNVLVQLVERLGSWRGEARFSTWLVGITINACHDYRRRHSSFRRLREGLLNVLGGAEPAATSDPLRRRWLSSVLGQLDPKLRATIVLVAGEGLSHAEAALQLGISENTVAWRMNQIRKRLSVALGEEVRNER